MTNNSEEVVLKLWMLDRLINHSGLLGKNFPAKVGFGIARAFSKARSEYKVYTESRMNVINRFYDREKSDEMPDGQFYIPPDKLGEFNKEISELDNAEINLGVKKIIANYDDLPELSLEEMEVLVPILDIKNL